jgi:hypothetical protein
VPPGGIRPHIAVAQTPGAVVVGALLPTADAGPGAGPLQRAAVTLAAPLGRRVLLDAATGLPVRRFAST